MHARRKPLAVALAVSVAAAFLVMVGAVPASATDPTFPSWADVLNAEKNAAAKKAEVANIESLIAGLQSQSAASGKVALIAGEKYDEAEAALQTATASTKKLKALASAAKKKATAANREAGQIAAQLAREGNGNLSLDMFLNGDRAGNLLDALGTMTNMGEAAQEVFAKAEQAHKTAAALGSQASAAQAALAKTAASAKAAYATAQDAASTSQAKTNSESAQQQELTAELASLNGVTASIEAQYLAGVAWEAKQAAQTTPPASPPPPAKEPGAPVTSEVATAIAFAEAQVGKPYVLGGYGPNDWDCSGLTKASWAAAGVYIGIHGSNSQYTYAQQQNRLVPIGNIQPGDILFYSDGGSTSAVKYHVTLYIGNGEMIEAPYPGVNVRVAAIRYGDLVPYAARWTG